MKLFFRKKIFSLRERLEIWSSPDKNPTLHQPDFIGTGKLFAWAPDIAITRPGDPETRVSQVKRKIWALLPTFFITDERGEQQLLKRCLFPIFTPKYRFSGGRWDGVEIAGNLFQLEYEFRRNGELLAQVSKELFAWTDTYCAEVTHEEDVPLTIAAIIAINLTLRENSDGDSD